MGFRKPAGRESNCPPQKALQPSKKKLPRTRKREKLPIERSHARANARLLRLYAASPARAPAHRRYRVRRGARPANAALRVEELQRAGLDCDPIRVLAEIAAGCRLKSDGLIEVLQPLVEHRDRAKAASELAAFMYPKRKAVELAASSEGPILFTVVKESE